MAREIEKQEPSNEYGLTDKQWRFVNEYVLDFNQKQAAIRAGYAANCASQIATKLVKKESIKQAIRDLLDERSEQWNVEHGRIIQELCSIAFFRLTDVAIWNHERVVLKYSEDLAKASHGAIKSVSARNGRYGPSVRIETHDKLKAIELLGRVAGLFTDREQTENRGAFSKWAEQLRSDTPGDIVIGELPKPRESDEDQGSDS